MKPLLLLLLSGISICHAEESSSGVNKFDQDRASILQLAGEFKVSFSFEETLAIRKDYELTKPYKEEAHELVKVVEDTGESITLQHLLVFQMKNKDPQVIKHWSQTWKYQDTKILTFTAKRHWETKTLSPEVAKGTWSQFVTQIDDSPRYEGYGTWDHRGGRSIWVSKETNRPLPRREYKKRKDYDIVVGTNQNVITKDGWAHEQHNAKLVRRENSADEFIAHEIGINTYERVANYDFTIAHDYWDKYASYWAEVRQAWEGIYQEHEQIKLTDYIDDEKLRDVTYDMIEMAEEKGLKKIPEIKENITKYLIQ